MGGNNTFGFVDQAYTGRRVIQQGPIAANQPIYLPIYITDKQQVLVHILSSNNSRLLMVHEYEYSAGETSNLYFPSINVASNETVHIVFLGIVPIDQVNLVPYEVPTYSLGDNSKRVINSEFLNNTIPNIIYSSRTGLKNYLINGNFDVWQRADSQTDSDYASDDRWANYHNISTKTHTRVSCSSTERSLFNANNFSRTIVSSVYSIVSGVVKWQKIENVTRLSGKTVTLSFWAKANSNKELYFFAIQDFGSGGTPSSPVFDIGSKIFNLTNTWQKFTHTFTIPNTDNKTIGSNGVQTSSTSINFMFDYGALQNSNNCPSIVTKQQSGTFDLAQIQLEDGAVATSYEYRDIGLELDLCYRYFEKFNWNIRLDVPSTAIGIDQAYPIFFHRKRIIPSASWGNSAFVGCGSIIPRQIFESSLSMNIQPTSSSFELTQEVRLNAEL